MDKPGRGFRVFMGRLKFPVTTSGWRAFRFPVLMAGNRLVVTSRGVRGHGTRFSGKSNTSLIIIRD